LLPPHSVVAGDVARADLNNPTVSAAIAIKKCLTQGEFAEAKQDDAPDRSAAAIRGFTFSGPAGLTALKNGSSPCLTGGSASALLVCLQAIVRRECVSAGAGAA
jgi:hypothetical protein